jgi:hypothetical protein
MKGDGEEYGRASITSCQCTLPLPATPAAQNAQNAMIDI